MNSTTITVPTFTEVAEILLNTYGIYFVNWKDNRGEPPVDSLYLISIVDVAENFWNDPIDIMCENIFDMITNSTIIGESKDLRGKSCHFDGQWEEKNCVFYIMGN
jgi:hypothetical protein